MDQPSLINSLSSSTYYDNERECHEQLNVQSGHHGYHSSAAPEHLRRDDSLAHSQPNSFSLTGNHSSQFMADRPSMSENQCTPTSAQFIVGDSSGSMPSATPPGSAASSIPQSFAHHYPVNHPSQSFYLPASYHTRSAEDGGHSYGGWRAETSIVPPGSPTAREQYGHPSASTNLISSHLAYANSGVTFPSTPRSSDSQLLQSYTPATSFFDPTDMSGNSHEESHMFPFLDTEHERSIHTAGGEVVKPIIHAMATKGFFTAQGYWTCYRRNYFALNAWYELGFMPHNIILFVDGKPIKAFAMRLSAGIEGQEGKDVELVQYTPKRDLGEKTPVATTRVPPSQPMAHSSIGSGGPFMTMSPYQLGGFGFPYLPLQNERDSEPPESPTSASQASSGSSRSRFPPTSTQGPQDAARHSFDRVQFKGATQNNGKRRASQQFYKLIVELLVDVRSDDATGPDWVRVAIRPSDKLVVRGRSPSHYKDSDGRVNPHTGRGGNQGAYSGRGTHGSSGGGHGGAPTYSPSAGNPGAFRPSYSYSNQSSISPGSNYSVSSHSSKEETALDIKHHAEPSICRDELFHMQNHPAYRYYPDTLTSGTPAFQKMESPAPISLPGVASIEQDSKIAIADEYPSATLSRRYGHYTGYFGTDTSDGWYAAAVPGSADC